MNKKFLIGSLFSLMLILSAMSVFAANSWESVVNNSLVTGNKPISVIAVQNATNVTFWKVSSVGVRSIIGENVSAGIGGMNTTNYTLGATLDTTLISDDVYTFIANLTYANASTIQVQVAAGNISVNNVAPVISLINVTDGTNTLFADDGLAIIGINTLKSLNHTGYLKNNNQSNVTVYAKIVNAAGTDWVRLFVSNNQTPPYTFLGRIVMTNVGGNIWSGNIDYNNWSTGVFGPFTAISNASYINMSFSILVNDTVRQVEANNTAATSYYNFTFDANYPNTPDLEMPRTTIIFAGTSVTIKCIQAGDVGSTAGVKTTTLTITQPDGETFTKEVPGGSQTVELIGSDIIQAGDYDVKCTAEDYVGWTQDDSTTDTFKVIYYSSGHGGGGGAAGGAGEVTTKVFDADFTKLSEKEFNRNEGTTVTFSLDGTVEHKITWTKVEANSVTLTIESTPMEVKLNVGESKDVDVTGDGVNDVNVKLVSINENNGDVVVTKLAGAAETPSTPSGETPSGGETTPSTTTTTTSSTTWIIIAIVVILIIIIGYFFMRKK
ncbi:MAG: hypothetical protein NT139_02235 [Candidatus Woesearchaeota archaeon]|nr:hypothetical protein [Candidatus Woesearchaeota archaeon]